MTCKVIAARDSDHVGDHFYGIIPTTPDVGEVIDLGVGTFRLGLIPQYAEDQSISMGLEPGDGRQELWIDPRLLYRIHDQTVEVHVEETDEDFTPFCGLRQIRADGVVANGDGSFQSKTDAIEGVIPRAVQMGDGLFFLSTNFYRGEDVVVKKSER